MPQTRELNHLDPVAEAVSASLPSIDGSLLLAGNFTALLPEARRMRREQGYLCVALGEPQQRVLGAALAAAKRFFSCDDGVKSRVHAGDRGSGWTPSGEEPAYQPGTISSVESFDASLGLIQGNEKHGFPELEGFENATVACWDQLLDIADPLLELIGRSCDIAPDFLPGHCGTRKLNTMRLLRYPPDQGPRGAEEVGIAAHTDFECITLLYQDSPGLELRQPDGRWVEAPSGAGQLIVLFDDMLETWTNGLVQATGHRVRRPATERHSIVMFIAVDEGVVVRPLPQFVECGTEAACAPREQASHIAAEMARARHNALESKVGK